MFVTAAEAMGREARNDVPIFVSTNVDTHLVISSSPCDTVADLRGKIRNGHLLCFPHCGDINVKALMVKRESSVYYLPDSIFVETAFHGSNGTRYLLAEVCGLDLCNQQEFKILSGKEGKLGLFTKNTNGEFQRQPDEKSHGTSLAIQHGKSKKKKTGKLVTEGLQVKEGHGEFINNEECTDLVVAIEGKFTTNDDFGEDSKNSGSRDRSSDLSSDKKIKKRRKKLHELNGDMAECVLSPCREKSRRDQVPEEAENNVQCLSERILENIDMDKSFPLGKTTVSENLSTLNFVEDNGAKDVLGAIENLSCEQQSLLGNIYTHADSEHVTGRELGTGRNHEASLKIFNEKNSLNGAGKEINGLQGKSDDVRECDTAKKINSKRKRSSKGILNDDGKICSNDVNDVPQTNKQSHLQEYKYGKTEETPARECDMEKKKLNCKRKTLCKHGLGDVDYELPTKDANGEPQMAKHSHLLEYKCHKPKETCAASAVSNKNAHRRDAMCGPVKYLDVSTHTKGQEFNVCGKRKNIRCNIDTYMADCPENITTELLQKNDTNPCIRVGDESITDEKGKNISSENEDTYLNVQCSKKIVTTDLEHGPETIGTTAMVNDQNCNGKKVVKSFRNSPSKNSQERTLNIEKRGIKEVVAQGHGVSIMSDKNGQTKNAMDGPVKYLDVSNHTENHQQQNVTGKKKNKHSRNDMSRVDAQERITMEQVPKNDIAANSGKGERDGNAPNAGHKNKRDTCSKNGGVKYLNAHHSKNNDARDLKHILEIIGTTPMVNNEDCNDEELKHSKKMQFKNSQDGNANFEKQGIDEVVGKGGNSVQNVRDEVKKPKYDIAANSGKGERDANTLNAGHNNKRDTPSENGGVKYVKAHHSKKNAARDLEHIRETIGTTPMVNNEDCNDEELKPSKKMQFKNSQDGTANFEKQGIDEVVAKGGNSVQNVRDEVKKPKYDIAANSGKGERDANTLNAGHKNKRDTPSENGGVKDLKAHHSKNNAARDLEHIQETIGTTPMVNNEDCNDEELKTSKKMLLKKSQDRTASFEKQGIDEVVAKGGNSVQNVRHEVKKPKDTYLSSETLSVCRNKVADCGLKSKSSVVPESSDTNQSLKDRHANNSVVEKHQSVDRNLVQRGKGSADVAYKVKKTTKSGIETNDINHSSRQKEDIGIGGSKFQPTAEKCALKSLQVEKLDTNDLFHTSKSLKENQSDGNITKKFQPENKKVASQRNIAESCDQNLKKTERSNTADATQSSEKNEDIDFRTKNDLPEGEDWLYNRKDNSVSCPSQKQTPVFVANDVYGDTQCAGEETGIDSKSGKLAGRIHDGLSMNRAIIKNTVSCQMEKSSKKPKADYQSKKNQISLLRSSSDVSTGGENENDSYTMSSSSKRFSSDSSDSYDSDTGKGNRDKLSNIQSLKLQTGVHLSAGVGKKKDNGGTGSIHSKFVHILAKKTGLGELFKIAHAQKKPESEHFGGDFNTDDSPSVDMVLETQESQIDPVFSEPHNSEFDTKEDGKMLNDAEIGKATCALKSTAEAQNANSASMSHPDGTHKVPWKSNSSLPSNNSDLLKKPRKAFNT